MAAVEVHKAHINEHLQEINDAISIGIDKRPTTIGLHTSACSISLIELYLHKLGKISMGTTVKHEWFKTPRPEQKSTPLAERHIASDFPDKKEILKLMYDIEENRNKLIYGKPSTIITQTVLTSFQRLHDLIKNNLQKLGEEIE